VGNYWEFQKENIDKKKIKNKKKNNLSNKPLVSSLDMVASHNP